MNSIAMILLGLVLLAPATAAEIHCPPGQACPDESSRASILYPAVVRVISTTQRGPWLGTGVLVRPPKECEFGVVLTADHGLPKRPDSVVVVFYDCRVTARILGRDSALDLAVLSIPKPSTNPYKIATRLPRIGDVLWAGGYAGPEGYFQIVSGRLRQFVTPEKPVVGPENSVLVFEGAVEKGVSGGVISNDAGRLVGIVSASDHEFVYGTHCVRILKFLDRILAPEPMTPMRTPSRLTTPSPVAAESVSTPSDLSIVADHLDKIRGQVADDLATAREADDERLTEIEVAIAAIGKTGLVEPSPAVGGEVEAPPPSRSPNAGQTLLERSLPAALAALGWSGPPSIAALLALGTATWAVRRRRKRRAETIPKSSTVKSQEPEPEPEPESEPEPQPEPQPEFESEPQDGVVADAADKFPPEYRSYAQSQADIYANQGGRDSLWDQTLGRLFDSETESLLKNSQDDQVREVVGRLRDSVLQNVRRQFTKGAERTTITT